MKKIIKDKAFTLAEVLITLTIIGVIAAITIPNLMKKWEDHQTVAAVKEAYAIMDNAFKLAIRENGPLDEWNWPGGDSNNNHQYLGEMLKSYLKLQKYCPAMIFRTADDCIPFSSKYAADAKIHGNFFYVTLNNKNKTPAASLGNRYKGWSVLQNGMTVAYRVDYPRGCAGGYGFIGRIIIDINGKKGPNRYGYDVFEFVIDKNGPFLSVNRACPMAGYINGKQSSDCLNPDTNGTSCGVWIMKHGNTDYKYRDVSAEW